ncbi:MAG: hypothetical protein D6723_16545 [Acidobacteria bacterium]|nr:MAG: hypothetical protein D6723_16545 [Acidobacteriota bacterium]
MERSSPLFVESTKKAENRVIQGGLLYPYIFEGVTHGASEPHRGDEHQATDFTDDHRKKKSSLSICESVAILEGVTQGVGTPHRRNENGLLENLCVLCASAVIFEGVSSVTKRIPARDRV